MSTLNDNHHPGLEKVLISQGLVTLLHIHGFTVSFRVLHDVLQVFTMFYECFTMFYGCFTMFYECFSMFYVFHNVLLMFHECFKKVSLCFMSVSHCFTMFRESHYDGQLLHRPLHYHQSLCWQQPPDCQSLQELVIMPQKWSHAKLHPE